MAWIELHEGLGSHPKTRRLMRALGIEEAQAIGHLVLLWTWALRYAQDGSLNGYDAIDLAEAAGWKGEPQALVDALVSSRWLDRTEDGRMSIHDWYEYAGRLIEKRAQDADRKRKSRSFHESSDGIPNDVQRTSIGRPRDGARNPNPNQTMIPPTPQGVPADAGDVPFEEGETHQEEPEPELKTRPAPKPGRTDYPEEFEALWKSHVGPRKGVDKGLALKRWKAALSRGVTSEEIVEAHKRFLASAGWVKDGGEYVPGLAVWLNGTPWDDYPEPGRGPAVTLAPVAPEADPWASHPWFEHYQAAKTKDCAWHRLVEAGGVSGRLGGEAWKLKMEGRWLEAMDLLWQEVHGVRDAS